MTSGGRSLCCGQQASGFSYLFCPLAQHQPVHQRRPRRTGKLVKLGRELGSVESGLGAAMTPRFPPFRLRRRPVLLSPPPPVVVALGPSTAS